jgi:hypothetical protein
MREGRVRIETHVKWAFVIADSYERFVHQTGIVELLVA